MRYEKINEDRIWSKMRDSHSFWRGDRIFARYLRKSKLETRVQHPLLLSRRNLRTETPEAKLSCDQKYILLTGTTKKHNHRIILW